MKHANSFDLNTVLSMPPEEITGILKPIIFHNQISLQLKKFCKAVSEEYQSWDNFVDELMGESIFDIFEKLRQYKGTRITFKNLAAMKIFVGMNDNVPIFDTHVAKVLGFDKREQSKYKVQRKLFENLLEFSEKITSRLKDVGLNATIAKWSLAIWFDKANIRASQLLIS